MEHIMPQHRTSYHVATRALAVLAIGALAACSSSSTEPAAVPTSLSLVSGAAQTGIVGTALASPVIFKLMDQNGAPMSGVAVSFSTSSGALSTTSATTDATGQVSVSWTLGTISGTDSLTASATGISAATITAAASPGAPAAIVVQGGASQVATAGATLGSPIVVRVNDQYGNAVPGVTLQWSDDANGTFASQTAVTDAAGLASNVYTLGPTPGVENISIAVMAATVPITMSIVETGA